MPLNLNKREIRSCKLNGVKLAVIIDHVCKNVFNIDVYKVQAVGVNVLTNY